MVYSVASAILKSVWSVGVYLASLSAESPTTLTSNSPATTDASRAAPPPSSHSSTVSLRTIFEKCREKKRAPTRCSRSGQKLWTISSPVFASDVAAPFKKRDTLIWICWKFQTEVISNETKLTCTDKFYICVFDALAEKNNEKKSIGKKLMVKQ